MRKFIEDKAYRVEFWDHSTGVGAPVKCVVWGQCIDNCTLYVTLSHWIVLDSDMDLVTNNYEPTTILKSTIIRKRVLY